MPDEKKVTIESFRGFAIGNIRDERGQELKVTAWYSDEGYGERVSATCLQNGILSTIESSATTSQTLSDAIKDALTKTDFPNGISGQEIYVRYHAGATGKVPETTPGEFPYKDASPMDILCASPFVQELHDNRMPKAQNR